MAAGEKAEVDHQQRPFDTTKNIQSVTSNVDENTSASQPQQATQTQPWSDHEISTGVDAGPDGLGEKFVQQEKAPDAEKGSLSSSSSQTATNSAKDADVSPDGGYGWVVVLGVFLINFHSWGINSTYGVFLAYYLSHNTYPGATYLEFAFIGGLSIGVALLIAPIATNTTRRFNTRVTLTIGIIFETIALITAGSTTQIWQLFLSQGIAFGLGMGFLFVGSVGLAPQWFSKRRSLANGVCAAGSGIGALTYSLAVGAIIERVSLAWAFRVLGICAFAANTFATIIVKDRNNQVGAKPVGLDWKLFKKWEFVLLQSWGFFFILGYVVVLFSLSNYAKVVVGLSSSQASILSALLNLGQGIGRPPTGYFSDAFGRLNMAAFTTLLSGVFILAIWIPANSYAVLIVYAILGGSVLGGYWATVAVVSAEVVGLPDLPSALSITWLVLGLPSTFSEPIALEIAQRAPAKYLGAQVFAGIMYVMAAASLLPIRAWKVREVDTAQREKESGGGENEGVKKMGFFKAMFLVTKV